MPIVVIFLVVAGALVIAILYPHLRAIALGVVAFFAILFGIYFATLGPLGSGGGAAIAPDELTLSALSLDQDARSATLSGTVRNGSERYRLRSFELQVTIYDCPPDTPAEAAGPESCAIIGEDEGIARADVPPGQLRRFDAVLSFPAMPAPQGTPIWRERILSTRATE